MTRVCIGGVKRSSVLRDRGCVESAGQHHFTAMGFSFGTSMRGQKSWNSRGRLDARAKGSTTSMLGTSTIQSANVFLACQGPLDHSRDDWLRHGDFEKELSHVAEDNGLDPWVIQAKSAHPTWHLQGLWQRRSAGCTQSLSLSHVMNECICGEPE
jgi:hypothetical protein